MKPLRTGIVGAGFGAYAHLPALKHHPRFEVVAIASPAKAHDVARREQIPHSFRSCQEMLAGCELDVVTIASPPFTHAEDVLAALAANKHVLCEKPFAMSVADAQAMRDAAAAAGTACGISHEFRFVAQVAAIKELAANGHLGALRNIEVTMLRTTLREEQTRARSWWFERERGGGLAGALLSHLIDQANWIAGTPPLRSAGLSRTANPQRHDDAGSFISTVDDGAAALVEYGNAALARICADGTAAVDGFTLAVHGERRTAVASGPDLDNLALYTIDGETTDELDCKPSPYDQRSSINANVPLLMELYDQLLEQIEGKPNDLPSFDDGLATQRVLASAGYGS
ncbi:MAG TPA: Gfo/Idh/MocA family oxidoreductase [Candidatus Cybelea sp.]|jgi:predicted dehydrogenase|nr:Gfo/Idh/MocA family oxidoreductase [Candidatus Cybelea sp.]